MKKIIILILLTGALLALAATQPTYALKKRVRAPKAAGVGYSSVKLSRDTHSVVATFYGTPSTARFDYVLSYAANGIDQGVVGSFVGAGTETRDLYFGTCSKGVCTPHYGITGATLTITTTLKNGSSYIKRYILKNV